MHCRNASTASTTSTQVSRARANTNAKSEPKTRCGSPLIFSGMHLLLVDKGIGSVQLQIIKKRIAENGCFVCLVSLILKGGVLDSTLTRHTLAVISKFVLLTIL